MKNTEQEKGFTLVELSIVLVIIGVLIGAILKGQELIESSRIDSTIADIISVQSYVGTFREKYKEYPGDMLQATKRLPDCTSANYCINGNGNGTVGGSAGNPIDAVVSSQPETIQFWKHLALAGLMSGVTPGANYTTPRKAVTNPQVPIRSGAMEFFFNTGPMPGDSRPAHYLRITSNLLDGSVPRAQAGSVSPDIAAQFENKMDDNNTETGKLRFLDVGGGKCDYAQTANNKDKDTCVLFYKYNP